MTVAALLQYLAARGDRQGPLFLCTDGRPLTKTKFVAEVRSALTEAKLPASDYAGHSFRIGAATTAAAAGLPFRHLEGGKVLPTCYISV